MELIDETREETFAIDTDLVTPVNDGTHFRDNTASTTDGFAHVSTPITCTPIPLTAGSNSITSNGSVSNIFNTFHGPQGIGSKQGSSACISVEFPDISDLNLTILSENINFNNNNNNTDSNNNFDINKHPNNNYNQLYQIPNKIRIQPSPLETLINYDPNASNTSNTSNTSDSYENDSNGSSHSYDMNTQDLLATIVTPTSQVGILTQNNSNETNETDTVGKGGIDDKDCINTDYKISKISKELDVVSVDRLESSHYTKNNKLIATGYKSYNVNDLSNNNNNVSSVNNVNNNLSNNKKNNCGSNNTNYRKSGLNMDNNHANGISGTSDSSGSDISGVVGVDDNNKSTENIAELDAKSVYVNTIQTTNLIKALPNILLKFDELFPFYRLRDKDCKELAEIVYNEIDNINKIFCNSIGRSVFVKIYYKGINKPKIISYFNGDDNDKQVLTWTNIIMNEEYCLKHLN